MADLTEQQLLSQDPEVLGLQRQRQLANLLTGQAFNQPQGQVISGHYVKPSALQQALPMINAGIGALTNASLDEKQLALANALRGRGVEETQKILELAKTNPNEALALASNAQTPQGKAFAPALMANVLPKTPDAVAKYKFAQTPEGGNYKGSLADFENQMNEFQKKSLALQAANQNKPQIIETANGYVAVNPNNPNQATPVMFNGQQVMGSKGNLPEGATGQVTGVQNVKSALTDLKANLKDFTTFDMANPNKRALIATDYQNAILQLKEAMKLGVLNGNDYTILTSMITDPNSPKALLIDKKTQMQQINNLESKLDQMTSNVYKTHQKSVPANLQSNVAMPTTAPANTKMPVLKYNLQTGQWE
jgi:hypothetical protein